METYDFYRLYLAMRLHFTSDKYDIVEKRGNVSMKQSTFETRHNTYRIQSLAKKFNRESAIEFMLANQVAGDTYGGVYSDAGQAHDVYLEWKGRMLRLKQQFVTDLSTLFYQAQARGVSDLFDCKNGHPFILSAYLYKYISIETLVIINKVSPFISVVDSQIEHDIIWKDTRKLLTKYSRFLKIVNEKEFYIEAYRYAKSEFDSSIPDIVVEETIPEQQVTENISDPLEFLK